jgi:hypothetical protein
VWRKRPTGCLLRKANQFAAEGRDPTAFRDHTAVGEPVGPYGIIDPSPTLPTLPRASVRGPGLGRVRIVPHWSVEREGRNRDKGDQVDRPQRVRSSSVSRLGPVSLLWFGRDDHVVPLH